MIRLKRQLVIGLLGYPGARLRSVGIPSRIKQRIKFQAGLHWVIVFSICLFTMVAGCGYTTRSMISSEFRTIYITPFVNKIVITREADTLNKYRINRPMLETDITKAVTDRYMFDGNLRPSPKEVADLTLIGEVTEFRKDPVRYVENSDDVLEYRINVVANLKLWNNKKGVVVWEEGGFTGQWSFFVTGPQATSESGAVANAITDFARRVVERTVEQW